MNKCPNCKSTNVDSNDIYFFCLDCKFQEFWTDDPDIILEKYKEIREKFLTQSREDTDAKK